jgi:HAD superfamily hydrolase (TIGR01549 family)
MARGIALSGAELTKPLALLLDFGGVVVTGTRRPGWSAELAAEIHAKFALIGFTAPDAERIRQDVEYGCEADSRWKDAMSRRREPRELTHRQFWVDFVAADWPAPALAWVAAEATALCGRMGELRHDRVFRPGLPDLLDTADALGIPVGIVSNALSGAVHRDHLRRHGLGTRFAVQVYSDETGIRKPHPGMITAAADALGVPVGSAWYVGDNVDRDVLCARRAGAGAAILVEDARTHHPPFRPFVDADALLPDLHALRALLAAAPDRPPTGPGCSG